MWLYAGKRLLMTIPTLLLVSVMVFALIRLIPGDAAQLMLSDRDSEAAVEAMRQQLGLDRPIPVQYLLWLGSVLQGDLGVSIANRRPVAELLASRFQVTASFVMVALALATLLSVPAGMLAALKQNSRLDFSIVFATILLLSVPSFWVGLMLLLVFGAKLGWLPTIGYVSFSQDFGAAALYLVMPVVTLVITEVAVLTRMVRSSTLEVLRLDYITHARAKGLSEAAVLLRHAFKNAFGPTLTLIGLLLGSLLAGAAVVETVFSIPGLGRLLVDSIYARDYPVLQGCLLLITVTYVLTNLAVDLLYTLFDPRVQL